MRGSRVFVFAMTLVIVVTLIFLSIRGTLGPLESAGSVPLSVVQRLTGRTTRGVSGFVDDVAEFRELRERNADLEEALAVYQAELAELREKGADYDRLAALLEYDRFGPEDREYVTCNVIGLDSTGFVRAIQLDCGRRDGVEVLDPVVTELGLVGRVVKVSATGAEVLLLPDPNSSINASIRSERELTPSGLLVPVSPVIEPGPDAAPGDPGATPANPAAEAEEPEMEDVREDGLVVGQFTGDLVMSYIPVDAVVGEGDLVLTNGLGQSLPADLVVGQVMSVSLAENELWQQARVRSLVDFDRLEIVQVITNFEPVDVSVFEEEEDDEAGAP
ncbi:MAG: rod shape-determining protein MreC [Chloroflexi bacterium]|nr:rod shape-determining protein MreC [Chloroflexota bacterium]